MLLPKNVENKTQHSAENIKMPEDGERPTLEIRYYYYYYYHYYYYYYYYYYYIFVLAAY